MVVEVRGGGVGKEIGPADICRRGRELLVGVAASVGEGDKPVLATFTEEVPNGARLK